MGDSDQATNFLRHLAQISHTTENEESEAKNHDYQRYVPLMLQGHTFPGLVDSGNTYHSCISDSCARQLGFAQDQLKPVRDRVGVAAGKEKLTILGQVPSTLSLQMGGSATKLRFRPMVVKGLCMPVNLSGPFLRRHHIDQIHSKGVLRFQSKDIPLFSSDKLTHDWAEAAVSQVYVASTVVVPPRCSKFIPVRAPEIERRAMKGGDGLVRGSDQFMERTDLHPWMDALVTARDDGGFHVGVLNSKPYPITIKEGTNYGEFTKACPPGQKDTHPWHICVLEEEPQQEQTGLTPEEARGKGKKEDGLDSPGSKPKTEEEKISWIKEAFRLGASPHLSTPELQHQAALLLLRFWPILGQDGGFGKTDLLEHEIHLTPGPPIKCRHRPINPALEDSLKEQLDKWLATDVIEPSQSPWSFALVAAPKKNGRIRWCVDFRRLNERTIADTFPLPQVEDNLSRLANSQVFSTVDGSGAFHVVGVRKRDREKTAFSTPWGLYHFKRMPFGLCNGPATYCRLVQLVLQGIPTHQAIPYLDDTIVHSHTIADHFKALQRTLDAFLKANLILQPEKCHLFQSEVEYLGHKVTKDGLKPVAEYVKLVKDWPLPTNKTQARAFLGKVGYYRRFIKGYSGIAAPWTDVTGKKPDEDDKAELVITPEMKKAFTTLKEKLLSAPILAFPDFNSSEPFIVDTDWCQVNNAMGAVLSQVQRGQERVICYGGKKLSKSQRNYSATKGELAAVIYFLKHWRYYLQHRPFLLRTDHQPLVHIKNLEPQEAMVHRWLDTLASFDFTIKYRKGPSHGNADALSRAPHLPECDEQQAAPATDDEDSRLQALVPHLDLQWDPEALRQAQQQDEDLLPVLRWLRGQKDNVRPHSQDAAMYLTIRDQLSLQEDGLLYYHPIRRDGQTKQHLLVLPTAMLDQIIGAAHASCGHKGVEITTESLRRHVFTPHLRAQVDDHIRRCPACQARKGAVPDQRHTYRSTVDGYPFQRLSIDFVGPLPRSRNGNNYILTCRDTFSRWLEAYPIKEATTKVVARTLEKEIFCRYGLPDRIHSDRGSQFTSLFFQDLAATLGIVATTTPAYNPKSNPVERAHRDLKDILRGLMNQNDQTSWEDLLPQAVFAMNTATSEPTGLAPYKILFGRDAATPLDHLFEPPPKDESAFHSHDEYLHSLRQRIHQAHQFARDKIGNFIRRQRRRYHQEYKEIQPGSKVWLFTPVLKHQQVRKFTHFWTGPWTVLRKVNDLMLEIDPDPSWGPTYNSVVVSIDRLKLYCPPSPVSHPPDPSLDLSQDADPFLEHFHATSGRATSHQPALVLPPRAPDPTIPSDAECSDSDDDLPPPAQVPRGLPDRPDAPPPPAAAPPPAPTPPRLPPPSPPPLGSSSPAEGGEGNASPSIRGRLQAGPSRLPLGVPGTRRPVAHRHGPRPPLSSPRINAPGGAPFSPGGDLLLAPESTANQRLRGSLPGSDKGDREELEGSMDAEQGAVEAGEKTPRFAGQQGSTPNPCTSREAQAAAPRRRGRPRGPGELRNLSYGGFPLYRLHEEEEQEYGHGHPRRSTRRKGARD